MSELGPYSRTRGASRSSRESTPTASISARRAGRSAHAATPATARRTTGRGANRATPAPRDGDEALPPVSNKNSKAYGSSGNITGPTHMDINQAFRRPELAIDAALAEAKGREAAHLPAVAEESQADVNEQIQNDMLHAEQNASRNQGAGENDSDEDERAEDNIRLGNISAWAIRVAQEGTWFGRLKIYLSLKLTMIFDFFRSVPVIGSFMELGGERKFTIILAVTVLSAFIFIAFSPLFGPIYSFTPLAGMRALHPFFSAFFGRQNDTSAGSTRLKELEDEVSALNTKFLNINVGTKNADIVPRINWFESGQGAIVDAELTSPSIAAQDDFTFAAYFASLFALRKHSPTSRPFSRTPVEALMHWDDGGLDRWCAPASRGKLQLTVFTARPVAPKELIVEHIAKDASIYIGMAPKEVELWIEIHDPDIRHKVLTAILNFDRTLLYNSTPQFDKELDEAQALSSAFVLVGRFLYDIDTNQPIQSFRIPLDLQSLGVMSHRFATRVNSNWGSYDSTCLNRLRLYGTDMSGEVELLDRGFVI